MAAQTTIEYGTNRVRLLEFEGTGRKIRVLKVAEVDLTAEASSTAEVNGEQDDLRAEAIADAVEEAGIATDPSAMSFDSGHALFREFNLPFTNTEQVNKVVRFEAESHIPLDIDDVVLQHLVLRKSRDKSHVLAVAVKKDELLDRFDLLEEADLDPMFVDIDVFAFYHALVGTGVADEHETMVVINAQERSTSLLFLKAGELFAVRTMRMGSHGIQAGAEGGPEDHQFVFVEEEEDVAEEDLSDADRELDTARAHDYLGRLRREIRRTRATLPTLGDVDAVLVTGSGSLIPGFREAMEESFGTQVSALDLVSRIEHRLSPEDVSRFGPDIGVALGLAYKLNGPDLTQTDFRRDECAYTRKFDQVKSPLIVLSFLAFLVVALGCIDALYQVRKVKNEYTFLLNDAQVVLEDLIGDNAQAAAVWQNVEFGPKRVQAIRDKVDDLHEELAVKLGRSDVIPSQPSALAAWIEFSNLMQANEDSLGRLRIKKLDINVSGRTPQMKLTGSLESATRLNTLLNLFEDDTLFSVSRRPGWEGKKEGAELGDFSEMVVDIDLEELELRKEQ